MGAPFLTQWRTRNSSHAAEASAAALLGEETQPAREPGGTRASAAPPRRMPWKAAMEGSSADSIGMPLRSRASFRA